MFQLEQGLLLIAFNVATTPEVIFGFLCFFFLAIKIYHFLNFIYINHKYGVIIYGVVCFGLFRFVSLFLIVMLYCFGTVSCNFALFL